MRYLADFDELHVMAATMLEEFTEEEIVENILNILNLAYIRGKQKACEDLDWEWNDYLLFGDEDWEQEVILKEIKGKNVIDRIREHVQANDPDKLAVVIDTEYHRDFNTGEYDMAKYVDKQSVTRVKKKWVTQMDDRVRDTHDYLLDMEVGMDDRFYTYDGDSARFPGDFTLAENNCGCRCYVEYTR